VYNGGCLHFLTTGGVCSCMDLARVRRCCRCLVSRASGMRKTLLKVIRIYHQDKNPVEEHGLEWHLLCREITKQLNGKLELYK